MQIVQSMKSAGADDHQTHFVAIATNIRREASRKSFSLGWIATGMGCGSCKVCIAKCEREHLLTIIASALLNKNWLCDSFAVKA